MCSAARLAVFMQFSNSQGHSHLLLPFCCYLCISTHHNCSSDSNMLCSMHFHIMCMPTKGVMLLSMFSHSNCVVTVSI